RGLHRAFRNLVGIALTVQRLLTLKSVVHLDRERLEAAVRLTVDLDCRATEVQRGNIRVDHGRLGRSRDALRSLRRLKGRIESDLLTERGRQAQGLDLTTRHALSEDITVRGKARGPLNGEGREGTALEGVLLGRRGGLVGTRLDTARETAQ